MNGSDADPVVCGDDCVATIEAGMDWQRNSERAHFVIGPRGHRALIGLPEVIGGRLWHSGQEILWTNVMPRGIRPRRWRVRRSVADIPPFAEITTTHNGFRVTTDKFATFAGIPLRARRLIGAQIDRANRHQAPRRR